MKNIKTHFLLLVLAVLLLSTCDSNSPEPLTVTGEWQVEYYLSGHLFVCYYDLVQRGETLTGTFEFSDGSGAVELFSSSYIRTTTQGTEISMNHYISDYTVTMRGDVDDDFNSMTGTMYVNTQFICTWSGFLLEASQLKKVSSTNYYEEFLRIVDVLVID